MKKVLAISGGIDSVALLDMMRRDSTVIVAHFNHGIRKNSDQDELFVWQLAMRYRLPFISIKEELGANCSEAHARERRYAFLEKVCQEHQGQIYTAHHQDDLIETIAINVLRGTGWRGLVPFGQSHIYRPLANMTKKEIRQYAAKYQLVFRHDSTNTEDYYLRNRVRNALTELSSEQRKQIANLHKKQKTIKHEVDQILQDILPANNTYQRDWFTNLDDDIAIEILRAGLAKVGKSATHPQLKDFLAAIRNYDTNKQFNLPGNTLVTIGRAWFKLN